MAEETTNPNTENTETETTETETTSDLSGKTGEDLKKSILKKKTERADMTELPEEKKLKLKRDREVKDEEILDSEETDYALKKFIEAKNKIYDKEERKNTEFLINVETVTTKNNLDKIVKTNNTYKKDENINGWVFGRVDYTLSQGLNREDINNSDQITNSILDVAKKAKENNLNLVVGGAISVDALSILKKIEKIKLNRFETRKVIFSSEALKIGNLKEGMLKAVNFELLWLKNKKNYYGSIFQEDDKRIDMLSKRWKV